LNNFCFSPLSFLQPLFTLFRMTYDEAIRFWYGHINYEVRAPKAGDLKLERMRALLQLLDNPHDRFRIVHVTGTKGKGSTCAMLAAILQSAGYRVGLFTSPHLECVEERLQVDRVPISREELAARMDEVALAVRNLQMETAGRWPGPTFFEICTALGFLHFYRRRCDIAMIEVGLGGRNDSTNVCRPLVSVITSVGYDHLSQLGNTLESIAHHKAGIIKPRVPVVSGVTGGEPREIVQNTAAALNAPIKVLGKDFEYSYSQCRDGPKVTISTTQGQYGPMLLNLLGSHQAHNAALAVAACECLLVLGLTIPRRAIAQGLATAQWSGRVELVCESPKVILDTAHNVPSAEALVDTLSRFFPTSGRKAVIVGVSSDKQYAEIFRILARYFDYFYLTKYSNIPRAVSPEKLASTLIEVAPAKSFEVFPNAQEAWVAAKSSTKANDLLCITGSVFLAGELRSAVKG
jgi:dihydrofolate synthase/folylpolyglutamate synthase